MIRINKYLLLVLILSSVLFSRCAKIGNPTGGPKDNNPPRLVNAEPANYSTNFKGQKVDIFFDEFIKQDDYYQKMVISPPLKYRPQFLIRNRGLEINIQDTLQNNTTYTFNFKNSLADNNEGNILKNFEYVFSTGVTVDSFGLRGQVIDAFNLKPSKDPYTVMLYDNPDDSLPYKRNPSYLDKTDEKGHFYIRNVKPQKYLLFVLKDANSNNLYDSPKESIAFSDSLLNLNNPAYVVKHPKYFYPDDTIGHPEKKLTAADTTFNPQVTLLAFNEKPKDQYLQGSERKQRQKISLFFNIPVKDSVQLRPLGIKPGKDWYLKEKSPENDTIQYWLTDTTVSKIDSLMVELKFQATNKKLEYFTKTDTLSLRFADKKAPVVKKKKAEKPAAPEVKKQEALSLVSNVSDGSPIDLDQKIYLEAAVPIQKIDPSKIKLVEIVDSVEHLKKISLLKDSVQLRKYIIDFPWEEDSKYKLTILKGAFTDIYNHTNDTINLKLNSKKADSYGSILLTLKNVKKQYIVQLLNEKEDLVKQTFANKDGLIKFEYLQQGKYLIKVIYDKNCNGKWDTGNYLKKVQPERIMYYKDLVPLRPNWDVEVSWEVQN